MSLAQRLAALTVAFAILLVLGTTEFTLSWSGRSRLDDLRRESEALAETWTAYLNRAAPTGDSTAVAQALAFWPKQHFNETSAAVFRARGDELSLLAASDSRLVAPSQGDRDAFRNRTLEAWRESEPEPAWRVARPVGVGASYGVLSMAVSTRTLESQARMERRIAYVSAAAAALFLGVAIWWLVRRWVGGPLEQLEASMEETGRKGPRAVFAGVPVAGPSEIRRLAVRYNQLQSALRARERESEARGELLALEERARGLERAALAEQAGAEFAHEIGTPLNTVNGHLQLLREDLARRADTPIVERIQAVLNQMSRVSGIVRAKLERGGWPELRVESTDVLQIAERLLEFMDPALGTGRVTSEIVNGTSRRRLWARCDPALVEQILLNLFKNALEAMPRGGHIRVVAGGDFDQTWLEVADNGPGLTSRVREALFQPYTTTKERAGTGLGLPISRQLARAMGGDLELIPTSTGTRWRLTLPSVDEDAFS
ncbi:MAG: HAMP domain-containing sensor histidine kinase [Gemmatimonadota bacterium]